jgi:hypothetical protein
MTTQNDKQPEQKPGRSGDVQARQADDGSFELVVESSGGSNSPKKPTPDVPDPADSAGATQDGARPAKRSSITVKRVGAAAIVGLATVGVVVYVFSGDSEVVSEGDGMQIEAGFRPYLDGPNKSDPNKSDPDKSGASQASDSKSSDEDGELDDEIEAQEPAVAVDEPSPDDEELWEPEEQGEVVVIEEEHPPEEFEEPDQVDQPDQGAQGAEVEEDVNKPKLDASKVPNFRDRIKLPVQKPQLQRIPTPQLNKLQPRLPQNRDERGEFQERGYQGEETSPEYDDQDDGFDESDQGY